MSAVSPQWVKKASTSCRKLFRPEKQRRMDDEDFIDRVPGPLRQLLEALDTGDMLLRNLDSSDIDKKHRAELDAILLRRHCTPEDARVMARQLWYLCEDLMPGGRDRLLEDPRFPNEIHATRLILPGIFAPDTKRRLRLLNDFESVVAFFQNRTSDLQAIFTKICSDERAGARGRGKSPQHNGQSMKIVVNDHANFEADPLSLPRDATVTVADHAHFRLTPNTKGMQSRDAQAAGDLALLSPTAGEHQQRSKAPDIDSARGPMSKQPVNTPSDQGLDQHTDIPRRTNAVKTSASSNAGKSSDSNVGRSGSENTSGDSKSAGQQLSVNTANQHTRTTEIDATIIARLISELESAGMPLRTPVAQPSSQDALNIAPNANNKTHSTFGTLSTLCGALSEGANKSASVAPIAVGATATGVAAVVGGGNLYNGTLSRVAAESSAKDSDINRKINEKEHEWRETAHERAGTEYDWKKKAHERAGEDHEWKKKAHERAEKADKRDGADGNQKNPDRRWEELEALVKALQTSLDCHRLELKLALRGPGYIRAPDSAIGIDDDTGSESDDSGGKSCPPGAGPSRPPSANAGLYATRSQPTDNNNNATGNDDESDPQRDAASLLKIAVPSQIVSHLSSEGEHTQSYKTPNEENANVSDASIAEPSTGIGEESEHSVPQITTENEHAQATKHDTGSPSILSIVKEPEPLRSLPEAYGLFPQCPIDVCGRANVSRRRRESDTTGNIEMTSFRAKVRCEPSEGALNGSSFPQSPYPDMAVTGSDESLEDVGPQMEKLAA